MPREPLQKYSRGLTAPYFNDLDRNGKFSPFYASLSSYEEQNSGSSSERDVELESPISEPSSVNGGMKGMASAFGITSQTAFAITTVISISALVLPLFMQSLGDTVAIKTKILSYITLLFGFYMAWNIGANDVANAMGTSVGSGALTLRQAVLAASILEFAGAFLIGSHVSHTMQKGILVADVFKGKSSLLFCGMLSSLAAAGTWLQVLDLLPFKKHDSFIFGAMKLFIFFNIKMHQCLFWLKHKVNINVMKGVL